MLTGEHVPSDDGSESRRDPRGFASGAGSHAAEPGGGCWVGTCASPVASSSTRATSP